MTSITSSSNKHFQLWKSLLTSKGIKKEGLFVLSGEKLIRELTTTDSKIEIVCELIHPQLQPITNSENIFELSLDLFNILDELGTHFNLLICRLPQINDWDSSVSEKGIQVLCPLGDPKNLGALVRSCEAFDVSSIVLLTEAAHPFLPASIKSSAGSVLRMKFLKGPAITNLTGNFVALDTDGSPLEKFVAPKNLRLLVGEEGPGISRLKDHSQLSKIKIKTKNVESLNAVVATSIALFYFQNFKNN